MDPGRRAEEKSGFSPEFANRIHRLEGSALREIFNAITSGSVISFAGGLPSQDSFPQFDYSGVSVDRLQYGSSEGEWALRELVAQNLVASGLSTSPEKVLILSGSQQGIDLVAKLFVDVGTRVAIESPTYLAALQVLSLFGAEYCPFEPGNHEALESLDAPKLLYLNPTFQNPSGRVYSSSQRQAIAASCDEKGIVLFEDDPYRELVYEPCDRTPVCASLTHVSWVYQGSFSKTLAPGLRLGYLTCSDDLFQPLLRLKQGADLHSNRLAQQLVFDYCSDTRFSEHLSVKVEDYRDKRDFFNVQLNRYLASFVEWDVPKGGLFFWLKLRPEINCNMDELFKLAIENGVAFMPGKHFYTEQTLDQRSNSRQLYNQEKSVEYGGDGGRTMRLNFSCASRDDIEVGLKKLSALFSSDKIRE